MHGIKVIIPAYNEQLSVAKVIRDIPDEWVSEIIVINNTSTDATAKVAREAGATVLNENQKGYGNACLKGMHYVAGQTMHPGIIVFMDADYSDHPEELPSVVKPILDGKADFVIGSRALGNRERGSMTVQQIFGNWLATRLMSLFFGVKYSDLGPFRAIKYPALLDLNMSDKTYGWTVEMQIKAAKNKLAYTEVPVTYRRRIGVSKVSGTLKGTVLAGYKIISTIFKHL